MGADDFLSKPISDVRLVSAVQARASRARQLDNLMSRDSLTGLLKHVRIKDELETELARCRRHDQPMSVAMVDIDHFKQVNDTHGHAAGDQVIKALAQLLKQRLRTSDLIGRYGGEEFVVVLPECNGSGAMGLMEDIRRRFAALRFHPNGGEFQCTLSAGLVTVLPGHELAGAEVLARADQALYTAKRGGRNQVRGADET